MSDSGAVSLRRCTAARAEEKGKKRAGSELAAEATKLLAAEDVQDHSVVEEGTAAGKEKQRLEQEEIDYILSWDVSDVLATPDNMDDMPVSDEDEARYRAERKHAVAVIQEWVKTELEKHGFVEIENENTADT
ncbi:unnamed protein product [Urochloa decumbens]|uniref:Uncharacterized protein n=1 Tax=Urochloa decumbens TaxID=240449 RepID=A0ABC9B5M5_9POAL